MECAKISRIAGRKVITMLTIEEKIARSEHFAKLCAQAEIPEWQEECEQLVAWLRILKKAKFEYDEAWRIITHPTPDVTYVDRSRAQVILDTFKGSLGRLEG